MYDHLFARDDAKRSKRCVFCGYCSGNGALWKIQTNVRRLADDANRLRGTKELEDIQKPLSDALKTIAEIFKLQEEMMRRNAYISASGGLFIDRTYKYLRKQDRRKRWWNIPAARLSDLLNRPRVTWTGSVITTASMRVNTSATHFKSVFMRICGTIKKTTQRRWFDCDVNLRIRNGLKFKAFLVEDTTDSRFIIIVLHIPNIAVA